MYCSSWCFTVLFYIDLTCSIVFKQHWKGSCSNIGIRAIQEDYGWSCAKFMGDFVSVWYIFSSLKTSFSVFQPFQVPQPEKKPHVPRWRLSGEELNPNHLYTFFAFFALFFFTWILKKKVIESVQFCLSEFIHSVCLP